MIDLEREDLITLGQAAQLIPRGSGRGASATTLWRWAAKGCRGVRLEALRSPKGWLTSAAAVQRFLAALTGRTAAEGEAIRERVRERQVAGARQAWAERYLREQGVT